MSNTLQGDTETEWRTTPFQMYIGGPWWVPPPKVVIPSPPVEGIPQSKQIHSKYLSNEKVFDRFILHMTETEGPLSEYASRSLNRKNKDKGSHGICFRSC
jgi:hypothetical protein